MSAIDGNKRSSSEDLLKEREMLVELTDSIRIKRLILSWQLRSVRAMLREVDAALYDVESVDKAA
jgi:hypothetical protein